MFLSLSSRLHVTPTRRRPFAYNGLAGAAAATTDIPPVTCAGPAPFHRPGCRFIPRVHLVDAERGTRGDQAVDRWWKRFVKTCSGELKHCRESRFCKAMKNVPNVCAFWHMDQRVLCGFIDHHLLESAQD
jgi:hypothetical protein